jgi:hypothetical protein
MRQIAWVDVIVIELLDRQGSYGGGQRQQRHAGEQRREGRGQCAHGAHLHRPSLAASLCLKA